MYILGKFHAVFNTEGLLYLFVYIIFIGSVDVWGTREREPIYREVIMRHSSCYNESLVNMS